MEKTALLSEMGSAVFLRFFRLVGVEIKRSKQEQPAGPAAMQRRHRYREQARSHMGLRVIDQVLLSGLAKRQAKKSQR
ncbi:MULTISPECIES: hypothetical protein [Pseudomonas]|uniref:hypothetical protein n=1 Tax=Pseudomonas TaxID=286 RepID=UPI001114C43B|nr:MULTISPECIES: hypothetical protein [Pseudomonas]